LFKKDAPWQMERVFFNFVVEAVQTINSDIQQQGK